MEQNFFLPPGTYVLTVAVKNPATGQTYGEKVTLEVR